MNRRMFFGLCLCAALLIGLTGVGAQRVRHVPVKGDEIVIVKTALGVATIIQVPDHPNSVVLGDQDAFKIEYLDQGVTIKPIRSRAQSNLYIYTDWRRYNVQLETEPGSSADYVVYLDDPPDTLGDTSNSVVPRSDRLRSSAFTPGMKWMKLRRFMVNDELHFEVNRVGQVNQGVGGGLLVLEFAITAKKPTLVKPEWLWLKQQRGRNDETRPIQGLFLSAEDAKPGVPLHGTLQILRKDIDEKIPLRLELIRKQVSVLMIPKVVSWK